MCHNPHLIMNLFYYVCTDDYIQDRQGASSWAQCQTMFKMLRSDLWVTDSLTLDGSDERMSSCCNEIDLMQFIVVPPCAVSTRLQHHLISQVITLQVPRGGGAGFFVPGLRCGPLSGALIIAFHYVSILRYCTSGLKHFSAAPKPSLPQSLLVFVGHIS